MKEEKYKDNLALIVESQGGNEKATEKLIIANGGLVNSIAMRFLGRGTELEDLMQIGNMGLLKAIRTFDISRGFAFSTYAVPLIFGEIRRFLRDDGPIKVSRVQKRLGAMLARERERMTADGEEVTVTELARRVGVTPADAAAALDAVAPVRSLSDILCGDSDGPTLENTIADNDENERMFNKIALKDAIDKLPELRRKIILLRYFRDFSQDKTAKALGLSQVKVSREEKKILAFLQTQLS